VSAEHPLLVSLHQALRSSGMNDNDIHFVLDWIAADMKDIKFNWAVVAFATFVSGVVVGILVARFA
jgi:uncharacterized protein (DUF2252 family)